MYVVCVTFEIKPEHFKEFLPAVQQQAHNSMTLEADCHLFDVCVSRETNTVFLYEHYRDRAAFEQHLLSKHFLDFDAQSRPWVMDKQVSTWQLLEQNT
jgi:quinol monooxygenase YgiN